MQLFQLHTGDEFVVKDEQVTFKLLPSDDQVFLASGELRVENVLTKEIAFIDANASVELKNVA